MTAFYEFARVTMRVLLFTLSDLHVEGLDNVPSSGPLIVVANHLNMADPPLVGSIIPRTVVFMAKEELFHRPIGGLVIKSYGAFPVRRNKPDRQALGYAHSILEKGGTLGLFPEGRRNPHGGLNRAEAGIALIAARSGVPILPVAITGTEAIEGLTWMLRRPKIHLKVGRPFQLPTIGKRVRSVMLGELADYIMGKVAEILPPSYRGVYGDRLADVSSRWQLASITESGYNGAATNLGERDGDLAG